MKAVQPTFRTRLREGARAASKPPPSWRRNMLNMHSECHDITAPQLTQAKLFGLLLPDVTRGMKAGPLHVLFRFVLTLILNRPVSLKTVVIYLLGNA
jgi:hypothetical protein